MSQRRVSSSWFYLVPQGYRVEVSRMLPFTSTHPDEPTTYTHAVVDHVNKVITCSPEALDALKEASK